MDVNTILFETFDDMKPYLGSGFESIQIETLNSDLKNSLSDIEIMTGSALLSDLVTAYREDTMSAAQTAILPIIRKPLANICFYRHSNSNVMMIGDSGYGVEEGANKKAPYQWMIRNFQKQRLSDYAAGMNELWIYLLDNSTDFPTWDNTAEYLNLMVRPINDLKEWAKSGRRIANWRTHYALFSEMNLAWEDTATYISQGLVEDVNNWLTNGGADADLEALLPYLQRYIAHATLERAAPNLPISIEAEGLLINEVDSTTANSDKIIQDKQMILAQASKEACRALSRMREFLTANATASKYEPYYTKFLLNYEGPVELNTDGDKLIFI